MMLQQSRGVKSNVAQAQGEESMGGSGVRGKTRSLNLASGA
jgi:hypothetical protein